MADTADGEEARTLGAQVLQSLRHHATLVPAAEALTALDERGLVGALPTRWWADLDEAARGSSAWVTHSLHKHGAALTAALPGAWRWALEACCANGYHREAALSSALPAGHPAVLPLLVIRCSDWAEPVRRRAERRLAELLAQAAPVDLGQACALAWICETRSRGGAAVRVVGPRLDDASPALWQLLLTHPEAPVRRRALAEAITRQVLDAEALVTLARDDTDVRVALDAAEHVLSETVPQVDASISPAAQAIVDQLLTARLPQVRTTAVTVLRRTQRPDLASPFLADRSTPVRETARWVVRSHGQDPAATLRALLAAPGTAVTAGRVVGLAECADRADLPWLRSQLNNPHAKARVAALRALTTLNPLPAEELLALAEHDPSPSVCRAAVTALTDQALLVPEARLHAWLHPARPIALRVGAAPLLRARGPWVRLETDLRLLNDPLLERGALSDLRSWAALAALGPRLPSPDQVTAINVLLDAAQEALGPGLLREIRFRLPARTPGAVAAVPPVPAHGTAPAANSTRSRGVPALIRAINRLRKGM